MESTTTNCVKELYSITIKLKNVKVTSDKMSVHQALGTYFQISEKHELLVIIGKLLEKANSTLTNVVNSDIEKDDKAMYIDLLKTVVVSYNQLANLDNPYFLFIKSIDPTNMKLFKMAAHGLGNFIGTKAIPAEKVLDEIIEHIQEVIKMLKENSIEEPLKTYLFESVSEIQYIINRYGILDEKDLEKKLYEITGKTYYLTKEQPDFQKKVPSVFWKLLSKSSEMVSLSTGAPQLIEGITEVIKNLPT